VSFLSLSLSLNLNVMLLLCVLMFVRAVCSHRERARDRFFSPTLFAFVANLAVVIISCVPSEVNILTSEL
jgi:amino acid permease